METKWDLIQQRALETWGHDHGDKTGELDAVLGLAGEAGEIADQYKKHLFKQSHTVTAEEMQEELADLLYYVAIRATQLNVTLDELSLVFYEKLKDGHGWV